MVKRIIFDIDGTLIKGVNFSSCIVNALKKYGINDEEKAELFLLNIMNYEDTYCYYDRDLYLKFFSDKLGIQLDYSFLNLFFQELKTAIPKNSLKIKQMLSSLSDYELVLLSNYFEESQRSRLTAMGINDYFSEYYGEEIMKPNELAYKSAQGSHKACECVVVGDNKKLDIEIPRELGFKTIYVNEKGDVRNVEDISPVLIKRM